jgi:hypothetical protein
VFVILPNVRSSFGRREAAFVMALLARGSEAGWAEQEERLREQGFDALLDDPRTLNAALTDTTQGMPAPLLFYLLVRHALLEDGITDRTLADYIAALILEFARGDRAYAVGGGPAAGERFYYLADILQALQGASGRQAFLLQAHLGNFALWASGLFPDYLTERVRRRGAPGLDYYQEMGTTGYRLAADSTAADSIGMAGLFRAAAAQFPALRSALNRVADRHLFPRRGDPVERLLRQIADAAARRAAGEHGAGPGIL